MPSVLKWVMNIWYNMKFSLLGQAENVLVLSRNYLFFCKYVYIYQIQFFHLSLSLLAQSARVAKYIDYIPAEW